jgi:hypothetical protein
MIGQHRGAGEQAIGRQLSPISAVHIHIGDTYRPMWRDVYGDE